MSEFTHQLVLQLPASTAEDFDELVALEDAMIGSFAGLPHDVDGHDFGSGTMNLFVHTDAPQVAFEIALEHFSPSEKNELKAAYRRIDGEEYTVLWPLGSSELFSVI